MTKYETIDIELDKDVYEFLEKRALELNMTFNEICCKVLEDHISNKLTSGDFKKILEQNENNLDVWKGFYTIVDDFNKPIARIHPLS